MQQQQPQQEQSQQQRPASQKKTRLSFGRTAPLLSRQRLLPMELHAKLMPFNRSKRAEIPDMEPPEIPSFKNRKLGQSTAPSSDVVTFHSSRSISWSVRTADVANKLREAREQREQAKQQRLENNVLRGSSPLSHASSSPAVRVDCGSPANEKLRFHQHHYSPDAAGDSPPRPPASELLSPSSKNPNNNKGTAKATSGSHAVAGGKTQQSCLLLYEKDEQRYSLVMDPKDVALALVKSKLQARPGELKRPLSASISISGRGAISATANSTAQEQQQQQQQKQPQPRSAVCGSRPSTAATGRQTASGAGAGAGVVAPLAEADLMDAAWRLSSHPAPAFDTTGRGREAYPRYDAFGAPYRDDANIAVEHTEGVGATVAGQAASAVYHYHGTYVQNKKEGFGRYLVGHDGSSYLGEFKHGEMCGAGVRYLSDGTVLQGTFQDGELTGEDCVVLAPSGERYEGGYRGGRRHGHGVLQWRSEAHVDAPPPLTTNETPAPHAPSSSPLEGSVGVAAAAKRLRDEEYAAAGIAQDDGDEDENNNGDGDDADKRQQGAEDEELFLYERAVHKFVGQFVNGDPSGPGMQETNKIRRDPRTGEVKQSIVDTVQGTFSGLGPQGKCKRSIVRTFYGDPLQSQQQQQHRQQNHPHRPSSVDSVLSSRHASALLSARRRNNSASGGGGAVKKTVRRELFEGNYECGHEHGSSCMFTSSTTGIEYCGPMENGRRARIPNTIVLEGARVLPLENVSKPQQQQQHSTSLLDTLAADPASASSSGNVLATMPATTEGSRDSLGATAITTTMDDDGSVGLPTLPPATGQQQGAAGGTTNSGRRYVPVTQDSVSWAHPLTATNGNEVIQVRLCTANLCGYAGDENYIQSRLRQHLQQPQQQAEQQQRHRLGHLSTPYLLAHQQKSHQQQPQCLSPLSNSAMHRDETGRRLTVRVYAADAKLGVAGAARSLYHALGLDELFAAAVCDSLDPDLEDENIDFDIAAAHATNRVGHKKSGGGGGGGGATAGAVRQSRTAAAIAAAGGRRGSLTSNDGNSGNNNPSCLFSLHIRTLLPMAFESHASRKAFVEAVRAHSEMLQKLSVPPPKAEEEAAAMTITPRRAKRLLAAPGSPSSPSASPLNSTGGRLSTSTSNSASGAAAAAAAAGGGGVSALPMAALQHLHNSAAALAARGGCSREPLLQVSREQLANSVQAFQRHAEELADIAEDIILTAPGAPNGLSANAVNAAVAEEIRREINPAAMPASSPSNNNNNSSSNNSPAGKHNVPPLGNGGKILSLQQQQSLRNRIGIASRGAFVQSQMVTTNKGQAVATIQLAPLQASPGDLLFIVVQFADDNIVLPSPGGDPVRCFSAPLVVPLVIGVKGTPRGRK